jgi:preprotein translocase subunit YajC
VLLAQDSGGGSSLLSFLPIVLIIAAMYFLLIRPQSKRRREAAEMQAQLGPGDEIQTVGGLFGTVVAIDDEAVTINAAPGVELRFARSAIGRVLNAQPTEVAEEEDEGDDSDPAKPIERG